MNGTYINSRRIFKVLLKAFFSFEVEGRENLPKKGPFIIVSNHTSYADPVVVGAACDTSSITFMAKKELFDMPILGPWVKAVGCIPVERDSGSSRPLKEAVQKLKEGQTISIFPEGRRSKNGSLQKSEPGIGLLALKTGTPIVPIYISGTAKAMPKGQRIPKPCKIKARIGKIVDIGDGAGFSGKREAYEFIGKKVMDAISRLKDE
ncbi:MAG: lysophospholipid acyltransferase family protein [Candidatus Omnitrophota bacterium]